LEHWAVHARFHSVPQRQKGVGDDLLLFAEDVGADLIVLGGFAHAREREFLFGSVTRDIFQAQLKIPVLLSH
jgi:nucleotide-binding universal stress UspA family protein